MSTIKDIRGQMICKTDRLVCLMQFEMVSPMALNNTRYTSVSHNDLINASNRAAVRLVVTGYSGAAQLRMGRHALGSDTKDYA